MVERLAFIVVALATDKTGVVPRLDRAGGHAELAGYLVQGEHADVAEPLLPAAEPVFVADVADDQAVEGAAFAAGLCDGAFSLPTPYAAALPNPKLRRVRGLIWWLTSKSR